MKKILALMLIVWLAAGSVSAFAEETVPVFDDILFENGKDALWLIASGDYELALSLLNFAEGVPSAEDFELFITANFPSIADGMVQYEVAVAYYDPQSALWTLAIPVEEPENEEVETFVLFSQDGTCRRICWCWSMTRICDIQTLNNKNFPNLLTYARPCDIIMHVACEVQSKNASSGCSAAR